MLKYINVALMEDVDNLNIDVVAVLLKLTSNNIVAAIESSESNNITPDDIVIMTSPVSNTIVINDIENSLESEYCGFEKELKFIGKGLYESIGDILDKIINVRIDCFNYNPEIKMGSCDTLCIDDDDIIDTESFTMEYDSTDNDAKEYLKYILCIYGLHTSVYDRFESHLDKLNKPSENAKNNKYNAAVIPDTPNTDMMRKIIDLSKKMDSLVKNLNKIVTQLNINLDE